MTLMDMFTNCYIKLIETFLCPKKQDNIWKLLRQMTHEPHQIDQPQQSTSQKLQLLLRMVTAESSQSCCVVLIPSHFILQINHLPGLLPNVMRPSKLKTSALQDQTKGPIQSVGSMVLSGNSQYGQEDMHLQAAETGKHCYK